MQPYFLQSPPPAHSLQLLGEQPLTTFENVGEVVGFLLGFDVGFLLGLGVAFLLGFAVGFLVGLGVVGAGKVGAGFPVGDEEGLRDGLEVVGLNVGTLLGLGVGLRECFKDRSA